MSGTGSLKKIIAIITVIILIYNSGGYVFVYQQLILYTKNFIHTAIKNKEIEEKIILLSFKKSDLHDKKIDFQWKHEREFKYNGGMYDIVDRFETEDSIYFFCFYDHKENKLEENFSSHFDQEKNEKKHNSSGRIHILQITDQYIIPEYLFSSQETASAYPHFITQGGSLTELEVPSPPPKIFLISLI